MISTTITHGKLSIDFRSDGAVVISSHECGGSIIMSPTEFAFFCEASKLRGWPAAPDSQLTADAPDTNL